ncbi:MAG: LysM peptidoglycan-binding domain-containing protein [Actinomycetota bacterium]|nr:LysM peptidoglycan-binding domain-containing protein [Actinomycetota bacterium]
MSGRHVVRSGESLWLVAEHMLGDRATDAEIAAAVEQLWELNAGRIATGDPDLIYPGQALRLP